MAAKPNPKPLRDFTTRRALLAKALRAVGASSGGAVTKDAGLYVAAGSVLTDAEADFMRRRRRDLLTRMRQTVRAAAARGLSRIRAASRPTYQTGLFYSAWRDRLTDDVSQTGLVMDILYTNPTPYGIWVHRKGTPRSQTVVNTYVKPILADLTDEVLNDLTGPVAAVTDALREDVLAGRVGFL